MCFRPATVEASRECPNCGKKVNATLGKMPSKCPFCKTVFEDTEESGSSGNTPISAPSAPKNPTA